MEIHRPLWLFPERYARWKERGDGVEQRNRNTAILLIVAGLYLLFGSLIGYFTVTAVLILWLAVVKIRAGENNFGYILFGVAVLLLLNDHFVAMVAIIFVLLGLYYFHTRQVTKQEQFLKMQNLLESLQWNKEQWELRDMSISSVIGEVRMDFSLAVMEQKKRPSPSRGSSVMSISLFQKISASPSCLPCCSDKLTSAMRKRPG